MANILCYLLAGCARRPTRSTLIGCVTGLVIAQSPAYSSDNAAPAGPELRPISSSFHIFDATMYRNKPDLSRYGIHPANVVYVRRFWGDLSKKDALPERDRVHQLAHDAASRGNLVVLDIEHWHLNRSQAEVTESLKKYATVLEWFREKAPGLRVGYFGMFPIPDYDRSRGALGPLRYRNWQADNDRIRPLASRVDVVFPAPYTLFPDRAGWVKHATALIQEAKRYDRPAYVFLWPQYSETNKDLGLQYLPPDFWRLQLETARKHADGVVIWGGWAGNGPAEWDESAAWWQTTKSFISADKELAQKQLTP